MASTDIPSSATFCDLCVILDSKHEVMRTVVEPFQQDFITSTAIVASSFSTSLTQTAPSVLTCTITCSVLKTLFWFRPATAVVCITSALREQYSTTHFSALTDTLWSNIFLSESYSIWSYSATQRVFNWIAITTSNRVNSTQTHASWPADRNNNEYFDVIVLGHNIHSARAARQLVQLS